MRSKESLLSAAHAQVGQGQRIRGLLSYAKSS